MVLSLHPPLWVVIGVVLIGLLGAAFSFISNAIGMATKSKDALAPLVNALALTILVLSWILLPMSMAPRRLQVVSDFNPFKHILKHCGPFFGAIYPPIVWKGAGLAIILVVGRGWIGRQVLAAQTR